jgi:predicted TIM-barrel fold metal-dependent hydrolase
MPSVVPDVSSSFGALATALPEGVIDCHHHLINFRTGQYPWLQDEYLGNAFFLGSYERLRRDYLAEEFQADFLPLKLAGSVHIEAEHDRSNQVGETRWLSRVNAETATPSVLVGHVGFLQPDMLEVLRGHAKSPLMRGIRSKPVTSAGPGETLPDRQGTLRDENWIKGFSRLEDFGFSYDLRVPYWHLSDAARLAAAFPGISIAVNHCGLPLDRSREGLAIWRDGLAALAAHPQVYLKLSEFGMRGGVWMQESNVSIIREATAIFGRDRVMFGSNLPVSKLSAGLGQIISVVIEGLGTDDETLLREVFHLNARRFYRF